MRLYQALANQDEYDTASTLAQVRKETDPAARFTNKVVEDLAAFLSAALLTVACNREPQAPKGTGVAQRSVNASAPVFRNLGKRGESGL